MSMLRLLAAVLLLLVPGPSLAQAPQLPAGQVLGNDTASPRTARGASLSAMFDRGLSSTRGAILERGAAGWVAITPGTAGLPFVSAGAGADPLYQVLGLSGGGTNNGSIVASNGGIVYSDATKLNILAATATARQMLQSGASGAPAWSTTTWPATTTVNQLLYSSSANVIAGLSTANNGVLNTSGAGAPSITPTPTLGVNGGTGGQITFNGSTSGSVAVRVAAAAGTGTIFQLPADNGTSSYVLQTNGAGVTSWAPVTGTGNMVLSASPTLTGTLTAATISASGTVLGSGGLFTGDGASIGWGASTASIVGNSAANVFAFYTASTERLRIHSGGGISVGTMSDPGAGALLANTSIASTTYVSVGTKIRAGGSAPTITAGCNGAGSSISGSDLAGTVTGQTAAATTCTITFNSAYASAPYCTPVGVSSPLTGAITTTTTTLQVNFASTANYVFNYNCVARSGG